MLGFMGLSLMLSFASWIVGGEFFRIVISSVLPFEEPLRAYPSYAFTGLILGAMNALILYKLVSGSKGILAFMALGAVAGWGGAFALTIFASIFDVSVVLGWALGLATFILIMLGLVRLLAIEAMRPQLQRERGQIVQLPPQTKPQPAPAITAQEPSAQPPAQQPEEAPPTPPPTSAATPQPPPTALAEAKPSPAAPATIPPLTTIIPPTPPPPSEPTQSIDELEEVLVEIIAEEGITELIPLPNNTSPEGGSYPEIESKLGVDTTTLLKVVKRLMDKNYVRLSGVEFKKVACPHCQSALNVLNLSCRACGSTNIGRQRILQHEACGYLGPEDSFTVGGRTICPRCGSGVKILRGPLEEEHEQILKVHSSFFICYNCNEVSPDPHISFRCLTCGLDYDLSGFEFKTFYRYAINPEMISGLQEQKRPIRLIAEELKRLGFEVQIGARITGASKVRHKVDLLYSRLGQTRGAVFLFSDRGGMKIHDVMKIIVMKADTRIDSVKILCLGQLDNDSKRLAELYNILVIENIASKELATDVMPRIVSA